MRTKLRDRLSTFKLDHKEFEAKVIEFIELLDKSNVSGESKKKAVIDRLQNWLDEKIALKGFWELISDIAIKVAMIFVSSWVESIYQNWKSQRMAASVVAPPVVATMAEVKPVAKQSAKKEDKA